ncbi:hypothetical protein F5Y19DRAFT_91245 [Xylariaceae sp. FL1651]|nr:hypothetical protein F5Y19DRAFT_91245 [Xylariaceae sp. FL1651]
MFLSVYITQSWLRSLDITLTIATILISSHNLGRYPPKVKRFVISTGRKKKKKKKPRTLSSVLVATIFFFHFERILFITIVV